MLTDYLQFVTDYFWSGFFVFGTIVAVALGANEARHDWQCWQRRPKEDTDPHPNEATHRTTLNHPPNHPRKATPWPPPMSAA